MIKARVVGNCTDHWVVGLKFFSIYDKLDRPSGIMMACYDAIFGTGQWVGVSATSLLKMW